MLHGGVVHLRIGLVAHHCFDLADWNVVKVLHDLVVLTHQFFLNRDVPRLARGGWLLLLCRVLVVAIVEVFVCLGSLGQNLWLRHNLVAGIS